jgi:hypothetical protein
MAGGGKRQGAGRPVGSVNKNTADIRALAQSFGPDVVARLAHLALHAESEMAQIAAGRDLLDRGYGRAVQSLQNLDRDGNPSDGPMRVVVEFLGDAAPQRADASGPDSEPRRAGDVQLIG